MQSRHACLLCYVRFAVMMMIVMMGRLPYVICSNSYSRVHVLIRLRCVEPFAWRGQRWISICWWEFGVNKYFEKVDDDNAHRAMPMLLLLLLRQNNQPKQNINRWTEPICAGLSQPDTSTRCGPHKYLRDPERLTCRLFYGMFFILLACGGMSTPSFLTQFHSFALLLW